jgi:hypothetical protein
MSATHQHPKLGQIKGNTVDGAVQFLGIKYASLKDRLATAELISHYDHGPIDATKYGYGTVKT